MAQSQTTKKPILCYPPWFSEEKQLIFKQSVNENDTLRLIQAKGKTGCIKLNSTLEPWL